MPDHLLNQLDDPASGAARRLVEQAKSLGRLSDALSSELGFSVFICRIERTTLVLQVQDGSLATRLRYRSQVLLPKVEAILRKRFTHIEVRVGSHPDWRMNDKGFIEWEKVAPRAPAPMSTETSALLAEQAALVSDLRLKRALESLSSRGEKLVS
ncbi:MAG: DciA family protein [Pseudomonadota bacterium]|nr:DciA family protein [Pseudomonadota bacterium]